MKTSSEPMTNPNHARFVAGVLVLCGIVPVLYLGYSLFVPKASGVYADPPKKTEDPLPAKRPTILLTGFEPFGREKNANPSWEGIKELDGQEWKGYELVAKQLPVIWGAPLERLPALISRYEPVAIFSFGQGGSGSFAFETRASNERGGGRDNLGAPPVSPQIADDGPAQFPASIAVDKFADLLRSKGYTTRVSSVAGRYLCEEMLYSLEYLKSTRRMDATVMFCHVPSLNTYVLESGAKNPGAVAAVAGLGVAPVGPGPLLAWAALVSPRPAKVTPEYVQQFVKDTLETWHMVYRSEETISFEQGKEKESRVGEVKEMINRYFRTWSNQDMKGYDACFMPDAVVQYIDPQGQISTTPRRQFIAEQTLHHKNSPQRMTEVPESIDIRFEAKLARVIVFWKLTAGPRTDTGYDHFTLMKHDGNWRIVNLVFYPSAKRIE